MFQTLILNLSLGHVQPSLTYMEGQKYKKTVLWRKLEYNIYVEVVVSTLTGRRGPEDLCESEVSLSYIVSFRLARDIWTLSQNLSDCLYIYIHHLLPFHYLLCNFAYQ